MNKNRKNNRLSDYDYSQNGAYFVTICAKEQKKIFSSIEETENCVGERIALPILTKIGLTAEAAIKNINIKYDSVSAERYVIMPNHIHLIIRIGERSAMRSPTLPNVINQMKGYVTKQLGFSVWQKSYYDHIIRNENDYERICCYIDENPKKWENDEYFY